MVTVRPPGCADCLGVHHLRIYSENIAKSRGMCMTGAKEISRIVRLKDMTVSLDDKFATDPDLLDDWHNHQLFGENKLKPYDKFDKSLEHIISVLRLKYKHNRSNQTVTPLATLFPKSTDPIYPRKTRGHPRQSRLSPPSRASWMCRRWWARHPRRACDR